jgi:hypothetical protein
MATWQVSEISDTSCWQKWCTVSTRSWREAAGSHRLNGAMDFVWLGSPISAQFLGVVQAASERFPPKSPSEIYWIHHESWSSWCLFLVGNAGSCKNFRPFVPGHSQPVTAFAECADGRLAGAQDLTESWPLCFPCTKVFFELHPRVLAISSHNFLSATIDSAW